MKIIILNASPKGDYSITLQYCLYILKTMPDEVSYEIINVGKNIKKLENDTTIFNEAVELIKEADGIIWAFPIYIYVVPYQLMRFLEVLESRDLLSVFKDKYAVSVSSSYHFFDHTAHNYIHATSEDLGMKYVEAYSSDIKDLFEKQVRDKLKAFGENFINHIRNKYPVVKAFREVSDVPPYNPDIKSIEHTKKDESKRVVLLTDTDNPNSNLSRMTEVLKRFLPYPVEEYNINELGIKGGCLSCMRCAFVGECVYNDGFPEFHMNKVMSSDVIISAKTIRKRYFSPVWKLYYDRCFYNGHRTTFQGKHTANIVSGSLRELNDLREILLAIGEIGKRNLLGIVTDEYQDSKQITNLIKVLAKKIVWAVENNVQKPFTYRGVGGTKIFRDLIYSLKGVMRDDHEFYKKNNLYDFPNKDWKNRIEQFKLKLLLSNKFLRPEAISRMNDELIKPYKKILDELD